MLGVSLDDVFSDRETYPTMAFFLRVKDAGRHGRKGRAEREREKRVTLLEE